MSLDCFGGQPRTFKNSSQKSLWTLMDSNPEPPTVVTHRRYWCYANLSKGRRQTAGALEVFPQFVWNWLEHTGTSEDRTQQWWTTAAQLWIQIRKVLARSCAQLGSMAAWTDPVSLAYVGKCVQQMSFLYTSIVLNNCIQITLLL